MSTDTLTNPHEATDGGEEIRRVEIGDGMVGDVWDKIGESVDLQGEIDNDPMELPFFISTEKPGADGTMQKGERYLVAGNVVIDLRRLSEGKPDAMSLDRAFELGLLTPQLEIGKPAGTAGSVDSVVRLYGPGVAEEEPGGSDSRYAHMYENVLSMVDQRTGMDLGELVYSRAQAIDSQAKTESAHPPEIQETEPQAELSETIFENMYSQLERRDAGRDPQKTLEELVHTQVSTERLDQLAKERLADVDAELRANIAEEQARRHSDDPDKMATNIQRGEKLLLKLETFLNGKVQAGEVEPLAAKYFLQYFSGTKFEHIYSKINKPVEATLPSPEAQADYSQTLAAVVREHTGHWKEQEGGGFVHINSDLPGRTQERVYISADPQKDPARVLQIWQEALKASGLADKVYFKVSDAAKARYDSIVVFVRDQNTTEQITTLLDTFQRACPPELLQGESSPTTIPIDKGISYGVEASRLNSLLRAQGREAVSYSLLLTQSMTSAFELAAYNDRARGEQNITRESLHDEAQRYFKQFILMAGINPTTMTSQAELPEWARPRQA